MHKIGLTRAEIGLTQPKNQPDSNFRRVVVCPYQKSDEKTLPIVGTTGGSRQTVTKSE